MFGLTRDYYILYSAASKNGAGSSRSASREAEGTGPVTPRQPAQVDVWCQSRPSRNSGSEDVERETKGVRVVPATTLRCRVCETQYPLDPIGVCARCFGPLDPVYDRDAQRRTVSRESIAAGPLVDLAVRRPAAGRRARRAAARAGLHAARPGSASRRDARARRALAEARHRQSDPLVQGPRRRRRRREGDRARTHDALVLVHRQSRERRRGACGGRGSRGCRARSREPRAGEADRHHHLRREDHRRRRKLRRLQPAQRRAVVRARLGVRRTSVSARTTRKGRRRSPSRSPSSSAGACPTR